MQKWEYLVRLIDSNAPCEQTEKEINKAGDEGWELVATLLGEVWNYPQLIFKRPNAENSD